MFGAYSLDCLNVHDVLVGSVDAEQSDQEQNLTQCCKQCLSIAAFNVYLYQF